jgi:hypothetical protein
VELWEYVKGLETILSPRINKYKIQRETKKMDTQTQTSLYTKAHNEDHKNKLKEEILQAINENFIKCY